MSYKTKAFRKTLNGYEPVSRDFISSMKKVDQIIYRDTNKPFYLEPSDDGPKLTYNTANRTFSFYPKYIGKFYGNNEESATHKYCIEELSKLNELKINIGKGKKEQIIEFSFNYIFPEIILPIGENWVKPDLLIFLRKPYDLALKWNRVLAVEIVVTHDLDGAKLNLMRENKIPILRIKANKKWGKEKEENMSEQKKEELRNWIKNSFKKGYTADLLLDSKSKAYLENEVINELDFKNKNLTKEIEKTNIHNSQLKDRILNLEREIIDVKNKNNNIKSSFKNKNEELNERIDTKTQELKLNENEYKKLLESKEKLKKRFTNLSVILLVIILITSLIIYLK
jgi:hypothetical protein